MLISRRSRITGKVRSSPSLQPRVVVGVDIDPAGGASRPSESISRLLGPALPPTCVIKPLSIGYYPRKPRQRATNGGLVHPGSPARFPLVRMGRCSTTCNRLRCMTPSRNLTARAFRAAVPLVRIHLPPALSQQTAVPEVARAGRRAAGAAMTRIAPARRYRRRAGTARFTAAAVRINTSA